MIQDLEIQTVFIDRLQKIKVECHLKYSKRNYQNAPTGGLGEKRYADTLGPTKFNYALNLEYSHLRFSKPSSTMYFLLFKILDPTN